MIRTGILYANGSLWIFAEDKPRAEIERARDDHNYRRDLADCAQIVTVDVEIKGEIKP